MRQPYDVTALNEPIPFKNGDYEFVLPPDIPTATIRKLSESREAALTKDMDGAAQAVETMREAFVELMQAADPPWPEGVTFSQPSMLSIVHFLLSEWGAQTNSSMNSLRPPTSSTAPSQSENSNGASLSTVPAAESWTN